jgi:acetyl esterase
LEGIAGRLLGALPPALQVRLSGGPPVQIDGETLAPGIQLTLALYERRGHPAPGTQTPAEARAERRRLSAIYAGRPIAVGVVRDLMVADRIPARHYAPTGEATGRPLLVYYHGGGFVFGDLETHDQVCRFLCRHAGAHVLSIDYRLAPEDPFPAAVEDAEAAFEWAAEHASELGADPHRVGVGGDSAGGNLAAVVAQSASRRGGVQPALQLLIYPVTDFSSRPRSRQLFAEGFLLTAAEMDWFEANYIGAVGAEPAQDVRVSPRLGELSGLAPAIVVTAGFGPLRDDGEEYARALSQAGTPVVLRRFGGLIHAFINLVGVDRECRDAVVEVAGIARAVFERGAPAQVPAPPASALAAARG